MEKFECRTCHELTSDFRYLKSKTGSLSRLLDCRECERVKARESRRSRYKTAEGRRAILDANARYLNRPDVIEHLSLKGKRRYAEDEEFREQIKDRARQWRTENHERKRERARKYYQENKREIQEKKLEKVKKNPWLRLRGNIRSRVIDALKLAGSSKGGDSAIAHLPYSVLDLKKHLESQFDPSMNWSNYGSEWQLDHIIPQAIFPYDSMDHDNFKLCWSLDNLRPLASIQNLSDGNRKYLVPFASFDDIMQSVSDATDNPKSSETPESIYKKLSSLKLGASCPMTFTGISYLDVLFTNRFESRTVRNTSLVEASRNKNLVLRVVAHLVKTGKMVTPGVVVSNLKFVSRTPGHFFPGAASAVFDKYAIRGTSCLDPFLGWGGRTLGALCAGVDKLVGCDLQSATVRACNTMVEKFSKVSSTVTEFHCADVLDYLRSTDEKFGFVFTSPPYMDTEDYGVQSDAMRSDWIDSFMLPFVDQLESHLVPGGRVALHLKDVHGAPTFTAYHAVMRGHNFRQVAKHKYGRTWTQAIYVYEL